MRELQTVKMLLAVWPAAVTDLSYRTEGIPAFHRRDRDEMRVAFLFRFLYDVPDNLIMGEALERM